MFEFILLVLLIGQSNSFRVTGTWNTVEERIIIVAKFGIQQTDPLDREVSLGVVYGNITSSSISTNISGMPSRKDILFFRLCSFPSRSQFTHRFVYI